MEGDGLGPSSPWTRFPSVKQRVGGSGPHDSLPERMLVLVAELKSLLGTWTSGRTSGRGAGVSAETQGV